MDSRQTALQQWTKAHTDSDGAWSVVSGDASFRRYFRWQNAQDSWIAVDAPPEKENVARFVQLSQELRAQGVPVTAVIAHDLEQGFMLQQDLGTTLLLSQLRLESANVLYHNAMKALLQWQSVNALSLPLERYTDGRLAAELSFMPEWFMTKHLSYTMSESESALYARTGELLLASAAAQPQVLTHRDFHSRNLMCESNALHIIDFQDAVWGPITYDLVSLLKDCYIEWPIEHVHQWALAYFHQLMALGRIAPMSESTWIKWFDWMGLQRHLKVLGIFARLAHRDHKTHYLHDIPLTFRYCVATAQRYPELRDFAHWLEHTAKPLLDEAAVHI